MDQGAYRMKKKIKALSDTELEGLLKGSRTVAPALYELCKKEFDRRCTDALFWALVEVDKQNRERYERGKDQGPSLF